MTRTVIPAGYRLTIISWENDADNYDTVILEGLTEEQCAFNVDLCKILTQDWPSLNKLNNVYDPDDAEIKHVDDAINLIIKKHNQEETTDPIAYLYDLGLSKGEYYTRVCDSFKVEHIESDIILNDVTDNF